MPPKRKKVKKPDRRQINNLGRARTAKGREIGPTTFHRLVSVGLGRRDPKKEAGPPKSGERRKGPNKFIIETHMEETMTTRRGAELKKLNIPYRKNKSK